MNQAGTISGFENINVGASYEEMIPDWLGITIWGGDYDGLVSQRIENDIEIFKHKVSGGCVINHNINKGLPFEDNSISNIYSSHFIEHLTFSEAKFYFREAYRVLKPNGIIRTVCPDLSIWINKLFKNDDNNFFTEYKKMLDIEYYENILREEQENIVTPVQVFNSMIFNWGHKWMWDLESLTKEFYNAGFNQTIKYNLGQGELGNLKSIEFALFPNKIKARNLESIYVECRKL